VNHFIGVLHGEEEVKRNVPTDEWIGVCDGGVVNDILDFSGYFEKCRNL
jgi:hypothetical protein